MDSVKEYKDNIEKVKSKIENNSNYFDSFGDDIYLAKKLKGYLDNIISEIKKVEELVDEL